MILFFIFMFSILYLINPVSANQLTGFYMRATLALNGLIKETC